jgi:SAM-dependent methyltransferase
MDTREYARMAAVEGALWWYRGMRRITDDLLSRTLPDRTALRILDAGCGTGANLTALASRGAPTGIDITRLALDHARPAGAPLACASTLALPFADAQFDLVTSFDVLVMLPVALAPALLHELARVTQPGGHVLVRTAATNWLRGKHDAAWSTQRRYSAPELAALGNGAGLQLRWHSHANTLLFPLAVIKRLSERVLPGSGDSDTELPPAPVNRALLAVMHLEAALLRRTTLPFGLSAIALWQRPA